MIYQHVWEPYYIYILYCCSTLHNIHSQIHPRVQNGCFKSSHYVYFPAKRKEENRKAWPFSLRTSPSKFYSPYIFLSKPNRTATSSWEETGTCLAKIYTQLKFRGPINRLCVTPELKILQDDGRWQGNGPQTLDPQKFSGASFKTEGTWKKSWHMSMPIPTINMIIIWWGLQRW